MTRNGKQEFGSGHDLLKSMPDKKSKTMTPMPYCLVEANIS
jgi:hypothetical protein